MIMELYKLLIISILFRELSTINGDTDPTDASALQVIFQSLNNPSQLSGWSASGTDPCGQSWKGVTCSGSRVTSIKISGLGLTGTLGYQLTSLTSLTELDVSSNNLGGNIEYNLPPKLERLNLANNNFNGQIPYSISLMATLKYLNIAHNQLNEQLADMFGPLSSLTTLDLSYNSIPGPLPVSFSSLSSLTSLYLQNNQFTGTIDVLGNLPLQTLNIENNHFTGWIPRPLQDINIHKNGNSFNSAPAPPPPPGTPPYKKRAKSPNSSSASQSGDKKSGISGGAIAGIVIALLVVGAIIAFFLIMRRRKKPAQDIEKPSQQKKEPFIPVATEEVQEEKTIEALPSITTKTVDPPVTITLKPPPLDLHRSFDEEDEDVFSTKPVITKKASPVPSTVKAYSIADLQVYTGSFSVENLVGEGAIGSVYRAQLGDGTVLAVKKLYSSVVSRSSEDFTEIISNVSRLHHPNMSELVGYCSEHGQHLLVFEFHKKGSLHEFLHLPDEQIKPLSWNDRVKIALGSARALEYLHEVCSPSVIHKNFKSENILLDGELNPHVTDAGLASLLPDGDQAVSNNACAPEVTESGQYTLKSDVFSFGVVMLELLTGRKPFDSSRARTEQSLVRWATPQLHDIDALSKMVDPVLEGLYPIKSLSRFADVIALCVQSEPEFRPPMSEVVQALVRLVQRVNMSKRTVGSTTPRQSDNSDDTFN